MADPKTPAFGGFIEDDDEDLNAEVLTIPLSGPEDEDEDFKDPFGEGLEKEETTSLNFSMPEEQSPKPSMSFILPPEEGDDEAKLHYAVEQLCRTVTEQQILFQTIESTLGKLTHSVGMIESKQNRVEANLDEVAVKRILTSPEFKSDLILRVNSGLEAFVGSLNTRLKESAMQSAELVELVNTHVQKALGATMENAQVLSDLKRQRDELNTLIGEIKTGLVQVSQKAPSSDSSTLDISFARSVPTGNKLALAGIVFGIGLSVISLIVLLH